MIVRELVTLIRFQMERAGFANAENQTSKLKKALNTASDAGEQLGDGISTGLKKATAQMSAFEQAMYKVGAYRDTMGKWRAPTGKVLNEQHLVTIKTQYDTGAISGVDQLRQRLDAASKAAQITGADFKRAFTDIMKAAGNVKNSLGQWQSANGRLVETSRLKAVADSIRLIGIQANAVTNALLSAGVAKDKLGNWHIGGKAIDSGAIRQLEVQLQSTVAATGALDRALDSIDTANIKKVESEIRTLESVMREAGNYQDKLGRWHGPDGRFVSTKEITALKDSLAQVDSGLQRIGQSGRSSGQTMASALREAAQQAKSFDDALKSAGVHQDELGRWHAPTGRVISDARMNILQHSYSTIGSDNLKSSFDKANEAIRKTGFSLRELQPISAMIQGSFMGVGQSIYDTFFRVIDVIRQAATEMQNLDGRLRSVSSGDDDRQKLFDELYNVSKSSRSGIAESGDLFFKLQNASMQTGTNRQENLDITEIVGKALTVGGASTQEKQATILQLSQALGSGVLQGDELRSLNENASGLMTEIAKYFNTTVGGLRQMGQDGELTSDKIAKAILASRKKIDEQFSKMPYTFDNASTDISNFFKKMVRDFENATGTFSTMARAIVAPVNWMQRAFNSLSRAVGGPKQAFRLLGIIMMSLPIAAVIVNISKLATSLGTISTAMRAFMLANGAAISKFLIIAAAIALIALALQDVYVWMQGGDSLIGDYLGSFEEFKKQDWVQSLINGFMLVYNYASRFFYFISEAVKNVDFSKMLESFAWMQPIISSISEGIKTLIELIGSFIMSIVNGISQIDFGPVIEALTPLAQAILPLIVSFLQMIGTIVLTVVKVAFDVIAAVILYIINLVVWLIVTFFEFMNSGNVVAEVIKAAFQFMIDSIARGIRFITDLFTGNWSGAIGEVKGFFSDLLNFALDILGKIGSAIGKFVMEKIGNAKQAVLDFLGWSDKQTAQAVSSAQNTSVNVTVNNTNYGVTSDTEVTSDDPVVYD